MTSDQSIDVAREIDEVLIRFPAKSGYLALCRINASTVGSMLGFNVDQLDDLRLAVNESVTWLLLGAGSHSGSADDAGVVELRLEGSDGELRFAATRLEQGLAEEPVDELVEAILGATLDSYSTAHSAVGRSIRFSKKITSE